MYSDSELLFPYLPKGPVIVKIRCICFSLIITPDLENVVKPKSIVVHVSSPAIATHHPKYLVIILLSPGQPISEVPWDLSLKTLLLIKKTGL